MKKTILPLVFSVAWFLASGVYALVLESSEKGLVLEYDFAAPRFEDVTIYGARYSRILIEGCTEISDPGLPGLPRKGEMILLPPNTVPEVAGIEVFSSVEYNKTPLPASDPFLSAAVCPNYDALRGVYPARIVELSKPVRVGKSKAAFISIYPVRYNSANKAVLFSPRIKIAIKFTPQASGDIKADPGLKRADWLGSITAKQALNGDMASRWLSSPALSKGASAAVGGDTLPYRILTEREGIYRIEYADLVQAGINPAAYDPRSYKLFNKGKEIPLYFKGQADGYFDPEDYFEFYGERIKGDSSYFHQYSRYNVYWLTFGGSFGARMIEEDGSRAQPSSVYPSSYSYCMHLEKDSLFYRLNSWYSDQNDRWYWRRVDEKDSTVVNIALNDFDTASPDSTILRIGLHGYTDLNLSISDHWAIISLNGRSVTNNLRWDGQAPYIYETKLAPSQLVQGINRMVLKHGPLDTVDSYFLNWIEVEYPRLFAGLDGEIKFGPPAGMADSLINYRLAGFANSDIDVYKIGVSKITKTDIAHDSTGISYQVEFGDMTSQSGQYYAVLNDDAHKAKPISITANDIPLLPLTDTTQVCEYMIITHEYLEEKAGKLAAQRGYTYNGVKIVNVSDIFDAFNYGIPQDRSIRDFIRYAYFNWRFPPKYVLLLGGGSWDPKGLLGHAERELIPVHLTRTNSFGPAADDNYYGCMYDDILPEISIGRIPVTTVEDYNLWESKQCSYDNEVMLDQWQRDFMIIAGRPLLSGDNFYTPSDILAADVNPRYTVSKVYNSSPATTQDLIEQFNEGSVLAGYYGHGGGQVLSHDSFFRIDEVARLDNWGRWPLLGSFTCYSGAFDIPDTISISQAFLYKTPGGAIGVFSNSGPSWGNDLETAFFAAVDKEGLITFGDIITASKYKLTAMTGSYTGSTGEMLSSYNLLGDPGMGLKIVNKEIGVELTPAAALPGDTVNVFISGSFKAGSIALLSLYDANRVVVATSMASSDSFGKSRGKLQVPPAMDSAMSVIKVYLKDADSSWAGYSEIGINRPAIYNVAVSPSHPVHLVDSIDITAGVSCVGGIDSVWCEWQLKIRWNDSSTIVNRTGMDTTSDGRYRLSTKIFAMASADTVLRYRICLAGPGVPKDSSSWKRQHIMARPDLSVKSPDGVEKIGLEGKRCLNLVTEIYNRGETVAHTVPVHFYRYNNGMPPSDSAVAIIDSLLPGKMARPAVPWRMNSDLDSISISIDPNGVSWPFEQDTTNNHFSRDYNIVSPDLKVYKQLGGMGSGDTIAIGIYPVSFYLPDSSLNDSAVAVIGEVTINWGSPLIPTKQPDLRFIGTPPCGAYFVTLTDSSRTLLRQKKLWVCLNSPLLASEPSINQVNLYRYESQSGLWQKVPGGADTIKAWGTSDSFGIFIPMVGNDSTGPSITARVEQQATGWGSTIKVARPQYSVLIEDRNGINLDSVWVKKDGFIVSRNEYNLPVQPQDYNSIPLTFAPYLSDGEHLIEFGACDNLGNPSSISIRSQVAAEFGLYELACYPTPIDGANADFYFFVGDHADRYQLKIYTVAGRLVRTIEGGYVSGVKTVAWDICDAAGNKLANGVYFYSLEVWAGEKHQKKTEKLAVLR
jgi:hypothetical protein